MEFILNQFNIPQQFRSMPSRQLSGGYAKKAALACAFIGEPDVVIIDQPTMGLDIRFRSILHRKLREWKQNRLIIIGTSDQAEADAIGDKVWVLQNGRAIDPSTVKAGKMMTQIVLRFRKQEDYRRAEQIANAYF